MLSWSVHGDRSKIAEERALFHVFSGSMTAISTPLCSIWKIKFEYHICHQILGYGSDSMQRLKTKDFDSIKVLNESSEVVSLFKVSIEIPK